MRLKTGASIAVVKRVVEFHYTLEGLQNNDAFIVLDLDDKFDVILGLPWLRRYEPRVSWKHRTLKMPDACSSDDQSDERFGASTSMWIVLRVSAMVSLAVQSLV